MRTEDHDVLLALLEDWFRRMEAGETPDVASHCVDHPGLASAFRRLLDRDAAANDLFGEVGSPDARVSADDGGTPLRRIGDFDLISTLGVGGSGEVHLARQASLGRLVALKVVRADASADPRARRRLRREAEIAAALDHPHVVPIHDVGETEDGSTWIAMKWLSGPGLDVLDKPVAAQEVARIGAAAGRALHEAHLSGVIHRDVKPSNIMLDGDVPRVLDFGLARGIDGTTATTVDGRVAGTLPYMSPEQLRSGSSDVTLDARTDVYSLGATLYELLAGHPPFATELPGDLIRRILFVDPPALRGVDKDLATIVFRALDKDRARRFPSAEEFADDLQRYLDGKPIRSRPTGLVTRAWKVVRRNRRVAGVLLVAGLLAVAAAITIIVDEIGRSHEEADLLRDIKQARDEGDLDLADDLIDQARKRFASDDVETLGKQVEVARMLDDLIDRILDRADGQDRRDLATRCREIVDHGGLDPGRVRSWNLAHALILMRAAREKEALVLLEAMPPDRARDALVAAARGTPSPWPLSPPTPGDPIGALFTVLAMKHVTPHAEGSEDEARRAARAYETDWRIRFRILAEVSRDPDNAAEAYRGFEALVRGGKYRRIVRRQLVRLATILPGDEDVKHHFEAFTREVPRDRWSPYDVAVVADAAIRLERSSFADELVEWAAPRLDRWMLWTRLARSQARRDQIDEASASLERAIASAETQREREESQLLRMQLLVQRRGFGRWPLVIPLPEDQRSAMKEALDLADELAETIQDDRGRARALAIRARTALILGDVQAARDGVRRASRVEPVPLVRYERGLHAWLHLELTLLATAAEAGRAGATITDAQRDSKQAFDTAYPTLMSNLKTGRTQLASLLDPASSAGPLLRAQAAFLDAELAYACRDDEGARAAIHVARKTPGIKLPATMLDRLDRLESRLK